MLRFLLQAVWVPILEEKSGKRHRERRMQQKNLPNKLKFKTSRSSKTKPRSLKRLHRLKKSFQAVKKLNYLPNSPFLSPNCLLNREKLLLKKRSLPRTSSTLISMFSTIS
jgi:hypothetical protein